MIIHIICWISIWIKSKIILSKLIKKIFKIVTITNIRYIQVFIELSETLYVFIILHLRVFILVYILKRKPKIYMCKAT